MKKKALNSLGKDVIEWMLRWRCGVQAHFFLTSSKSTFQLSIVMPMTLSYTSRLVPRRTLARLMQLLLSNITFKTSGTGCLKTSCSWMILLIGTRHQLAKITFDDIFVGHSVIAPQSPVRNLGVWLDSNLSVGDHITKTSSACSILLFEQYQEDKEIPKQTMYWNSDTCLFF